MVDPVMADAVMADAVMADLVMAVSVNKAFSLVADSEHRVALYLTVYSSSSRLSFSVSLPLFLIHTSSVKTLLPLVPCSGLDLISVLISVLIFPTKVQNAS